MTPFPAVFTGIWLLRRDYRAASDILCHFLHQLISKSSRLLTCRVVFSSSNCDAGIVYLNTRPSV